VRFFKARDQGTPSYMEQRHCCIDGSLLKRLVFESYSHELPIKRERQSAVVHVQAHSKDAFLFEGLAIRLTQGIATVSQLTKSIISKSEIIV